MTVQELIAQLQLFAPGAHVQIWAGGYGEGYDHRDFPIKVEIAGPEYPDTVVIVGEAV